MGKWDQYADPTETNRWAQYADPETTAAADVSRVGSAPAANRNRDWLESALRVIPYLTGVGGGIVGGAGSIPGAIGGAAVGGAGGEAVKQLLMRASGFDAPETPGAALVGIGKQAAEQAALEGGGRLVSGAVGLAGKQLMRSALRPTPTLRGKFPNVIDVAVGEGRIPVRKAMRKGLTEAMQINKERLRGMGKEMNDALDRALARGNWYSPDEFLRTVNTEIRASVKSNPLRVRYMKRLRGMVEDFRRGWRGPMTADSPPQRMFPGGEPLGPREVRRMKQSAQRSAAPIYNAQTRGADPGAERALEGEFQRSVARDARASLAQLPTSRSGVNVAQLDEQMQNLIGLRQAMLEATRRHYGSGLPLLPPAVNWMIPAGARSPDVLYPAALTLTDPTVRAIVASAPRIPAWMLLEGLPAYQPSEE